MAKLTTNECMAILEIQNVLTLYENQDVNSINKLLEISHDLPIGNLEEDTKSLINLILESNFIQNKVDIINKSKYLLEATSTDSQDTREDEDKYKVKTELSPEEKSKLMPNAKITDREKNMTNAEAEEWEKGGKKSFFNRFRSNTPSQEGPKYVLMQRTNELEKKLGNINNLSPQELTTLKSELSTNLSQYNSKGITPSYNFGAALKKVESEIGTRAITPTWKGGKTTYSNDQLTNYTPEGRSKLLADFRNKLHLANASGDKTLIKNYTDQINRIQDMDTRLKPPVVAPKPTVANSSTIKPGITTPGAPKPVIAPGSPASPSTEPAKSMYEKVRDTATAGWESVKKTAAANPYATAGIAAAGVAGLGYMLWKKFSGNSNQAISALKSKRSQCSDDTCRASVDREIAKVEAKG